MSEAATGSDWRPNALHWGIISKLIHWLMAVLIIGMLIIGNVMTRMEDSEFKFELYQLHKSFGFTVMALALVRLFWRVPNPSPALPTTMPAWQRICADASHFLLYGLMFLMPLTGWLMVSASTLGIETRYFDLFTVPHLLEPDEDVEERMIQVHSALAWAFVAVLVAHTGAAVKHHLVDRDGVFRRMLPGKVTP